MLSAWAFFFRKYLGSLPVMVYSSLLIKFFFHANLSISILSILSIYLFSVKLCINASDLENYIPPKGCAGVSNFVLYVFKSLAYNYCAGVSSVFNGTNTLL